MADPIDLGSVGLSGVPLSPSPIPVQLSPMHLGVWLG